MKQLFLILFLCAICLAGYNGTKPGPGERIDASLPTAGGLVGYWVFNEGIGTIVNDASGNNRTGTVNGASWVAGPFGYALNVADNGVTTTCPLPASGSVVVCVTHGFDTGAAAADDYYIIAGAGGAQNLALRWQTGQTRIVPYTDADSIGTYSPGTLTGPQTFAITWDASAGLFYHNGVLKLTEATDHLINGADTLNIGQSSTDGFLGQIHYCALWNRVLTASEIRQFTDDPFGVFAQARPELYVVTAAPPAGGAPQVIIISKAATQMMYAAMPALPALGVISLMTWGSWSDRRRKAV